VLVAGFGAHDFVAAEAVVLVTVYAVCAACFFYVFVSETACAHVARSATGRAAEKVVGRHDSLAAWAASVRVECVV